MADSDRRPATETSERRASVLRRVQRAVRPPEIWSRKRPALKEIVDYARRGEWTGERTLGRRLGTAYAFGVAVPAYAVAYMVCWWLERPSRAALTLLTVLLLWLTGIGQTTAAGLAWLLNAVADLIVL